MKVLVTGTSGYLGSVLVPMLLQKNYQVVALDNNYFEIDSLKEVKNNPDLQIVKADTRTFSPALLDGVSSVVDLAAISQPDPQSLIDPALYYDINYLGAVRVATLSKQRGIRKYVFPSTCSVYGIQVDVGDEDSQMNPLDIYGKTKYLAEQALARMNEPGFSVTLVRFATLYGYSPKMRFDLLLNGMALNALQQGKVMILGDGQQRRPIVHVRDAARAVIQILESEDSKVSGQVFNIGSNDQNFKVYEVAELIRSELKGVDFQFYGDPDKRSYWVSFDKVSRILGYKTEYSPRIAIKELAEALRSGLKPIDNHWVIKWWVQMGERGKTWLG